jgi:hypothetical protein
MGLGSYACGRNGKERSKDSKNRFHGHFLFDSNVYKVQFVVIANPVTAIGIEVAFGDGTFRWHTPLFFFDL